MSEGKAPERQNGGMPDRLKPYAFKPGHNRPGPGAPPGRKGVTAELRKLIDQGLNGKDLAEALAKVIASKALKGDHRFMAMVLDRMDGKVPDRIAGHDGGPLQKAYIGLDLERAGAEAVE